MGPFGPRLGAAHIRCTLEMGGAQIREKHLFFNNVSSSTLQSLYFVSGSLAPFVASSGAGPVSDLICLEMYIDVIYKLQDADWL